MVYRYLKISIDVHLELITQQGDTFLKGFSFKVNVMVWLEFELLYYNFVVKYVSHYIMTTSHKTWLTLSNKNFWFSIHNIQILEKCKIWCLIKFFFYQKMTKIKQWSSGAIIKSVGSHKSQDLVHVFTWFKFS